MGGGIRWGFGMRATSLFRESTRLPADVSLSPGVCWNLIEWMDVMGVMGVRDGWMDGFLTVMDDDDGILDGFPPTPPCRATRTPPIPPRHRFTTSLRDVA